MNAHEHEPAGNAVDAWPFLVSRGRRLGYRVMVAPDFLYAAGETGILFVTAETGPGVNIESPRLRIVETKTGEPLSLIYRVATARDGEHSDAGGPPLLDGHGRPITMFEGYAVRGKYLSLPVTAAEWEQAHATLLAGLRQFLAGEAAGGDLITSQAVPLGAAATPESETETEDPEPGHVPNWSGATRILVVVLLGSLVLATVLLGIALALRS